MIDNDGKIWEYNLTTAQWTSRSLWIRMKNYHMFMLDGSIYILGQDIYQKNKFTVYNQYGIIEYEQSNYLRRNPEKCRFAVSDRSTGIPIHSATPETFTIGDGTQGDHDLASQGPFPWILRDGTRSTDRFHTILYRCISGADL